MKRQIKRNRERNMKRKMLNGSLAAALALTVIPLNIFPHAANAEGTAPNTATLRILETTDLHSNIMPYDYYQDTDKGVNYGLAKTASLIKQARSEVDSNNSMLFDAGDMIQGNPLADYVNRIKPLGKDDTHPLFKAMNYLKYDAGIVGNHEFNYGLDYLNNVLEEARFPIVNANIYHDDKDGNPDNDVNYFTPYQIIEKTIKDANGNDVKIKVGVIGFAPPQIMNWDKDNLTGKVIAKDIVQQANKYIPEMKVKGADVIVAIAHSGCDIAEEGQELAENAVYDLTKVPGIDAMLFGHAHLQFPGGKEFNDIKGIDNTNGIINGTPAVEAGFWGNNLGVLDLALVQDANGKWTVDKAKSKSVDRPVTADTPVDETIVNDVKVEHEGTLEYVRGKIGETTLPMHSYFSRVMDDPSVQIVNNAQMEYAKKWINNPVNGLDKYKDTPIISAAAPFKGGRGGVGDFTNIEKGDLSIKSANDLYLFNNTFKAIKLTGAQVKEWLEMSASQFLKIDPAKEGNQELLDYNFRPYNYDVIDGLKYQIDVTQPRRYNWETGKVENADAHRITNFTLMDGTEIKDDQEFIVATNNYRASGGGGFPIKGGEVVIDSPYENRELLMDYIKEHGTINPVADNNWKISPVKGAQLVFQSAPAAQQYLGQTPNVQDLGASTTKDGYETYQLDQNVHVQLLGINDFHGQLDYKTNVAGKPVGGIEYLAGYLKEREATNPANTLMVQAGDLVGASRPVSALLQDEPTIRFMNELGFDVGTIGNHEFDEGVKEMLRLIYGGEHPKTVEKYGEFEGAAFPYVVANVVDEKTNELILPPYVVKEVDGVKIGFIGVVTTETPNIVTKSGVQGVKFTDEIEAINKYAKVLKDQGIKTIVAITHDPGTSKSDGSDPTGKVVDIAKSVDPEVDVIYGAHDHKYLNSTVNGKLLVQSYSYGTAFSDIDLVIDPITQDIVSKEAEVASTFQDEQHLDAKIKAELDQYQADIAPIVNEVVGTASDDITRTANDAGESALGNFIADSMLAAGKTDFAFMNSGGIRDDLRKGTVTWGHLFAIQPFGNDLVTLKLTGEQIRTVLNQQWGPERTRIMQIAGLTYTWDDQKPKGEKVIDIFLPSGKKIDPKGEYSVTINNFMADGGDGYTEFINGKDRETIMTDFDALYKYVKAQTESLSAQIEGRIKMVDSTTAPIVINKPVVKQVSDKDKVVHGTAEPGLTVIVSSKEGILGSDTVNQAGNFSVLLKKTQKAGTVLTVKVKDEAGNESPSVEVKVVDKTPPAKPVVNQVKDYDKKVTGKAETGSTVIVKAGKTELGKAVAKEGKFTVTLKTAQKAGTKLTVTATDKAKNVSASVTVTVVDKTPPAKPVVNQVKDYDKKVTGKAETGATVIVKAGKTVLGKATVKAGKFTVTLKTKQKAGTKLTVTATDKAKNVSAAATVKVVDKTAPAPAKAGKVTIKTTKVVGKAEAGAKVEVRVGKKLIASAIADKKGKYFVIIKKQKAGTVFTITVKDKAGNVSKATKVKVSK
ncbi:bifunctional 2',3'-cyclic-nucleotide 2'-phosphodiesterase/3'-nucleotidase [Neobacillus mesonae]|uniref:bifunctional 2',3'-cyclic-nucleotide 2'-phosphodiesterase/3'-nucleotidase n=1 Tax=Neobacillus mesonae TaxID=1193713 RepID=UPI002E2268F7|nr:bifunctional 2',3'-cyclic-nucleotide 2'-phosphodiesterase/3'-nucleotidase [Neobacillus mesonae]MED4206269.1 bifunctional 2',3'-cyclic-nucleotide 2'-phosphodiesterase/3'-nucleotidase [Neobacillus mesonae]